MAKVGFKNTVEVTITVTLSGRDEIDEFAKAIGKCYFDGNMPRPIKNISDKLFEFRNKNGWIEPK